MHGWREMSFIPVLSWIWIKQSRFAPSRLTDPYRVVVDLPEVNFRVPPGTGAQGRGLVKAFRYGLVLPGGSRIVFDLTGPARILSSYVLDSANGQPPRLVLELEEVDRASFMQSLGTDVRPELRPTIAATTPTAPSVPVTRSFPVRRNRRRLWRPFLSPCRDRFPINLSARPWRLRSTSGPWW